MRNNVLKKLFTGFSAVCIAAAAMPVMSLEAETTVSTIVGDANCDGGVSLADAVIIMQSIANPSAYGSVGSNEMHITEKGMLNVDVSENGNGITNKDALAIQKFCLMLISELPEK